jgi:hypothetical protein
MLKAYHGSMRDHLAVFTPAPLAAIVAGRKTVETRLARDRRPPFGRVAVGDRIWLKRAGGPVVGVATVAWVRTLANVTPSQVATLFRDHPGICADPAYQLAKQEARFATVIGLGDVRSVAPFRVPGRSRSGWRVLDGPPPDAPGPARGSAAATERIEAADRAVSAS